MRRIHRLAFAVAALLLGLSTPSYAEDETWGFDACSKTLGGCYAGCNAEGTEKYQACVDECAADYHNCKNPTP